MYDDVMNNICYSILLSGTDSDILFAFFSYCNIYCYAFFSFLGISVGFKFLKDAFNLS